MRIAKGPRRRHSPLSGVDGSERLEDMAVAMDRVESRVDEGLGKVTPMLATADERSAVGEAS
jgi:hypothetical protein